MKYKAIILVVLFLTSSLFSFSQSSETKFKTVKTFEAKEAHQGIAVDAKFVYAINSRAIEKLDKNTGEFVAEWNETTGRLNHFDGGVVVNDKLYCAHSNYPRIPMTSSIEIFDTKDLTHIGSHSFGIKYGSCTWADFHDNSWWVCFAHYDKFQEELTYDNRWSVLVKFDKNWQEQESWIFPDNVLAEFKPMSCSGGSWGPDGNIYVTGHDSAKVYVLQIPEMGSVLQFVKSVPVDIRGQGIAWDRSGKKYLYGIERKQNLIIKSELVK